MAGPIRCPDAPVSIRAWTKSDLEHGDENRVASLPNNEGVVRENGGGPAVQDDDLASRLNGDRLTRASDTSGNTSGRTYDCPTNDGAQR